MDTIQHRDPISTGYEYPVKQRKVRKGTRSCWECKRRKVRCSFSAVNDNSTVCAACRRRRTPCVGQEFLEDYAPPSSEIAPDHDSPANTNSETNSLLTPGSSRGSIHEDHHTLSRAHKLLKLSKTLHAAFPARHDIDTLCNTTSGCFLVILQLHTRPREELDHNEEILKRQVADIPPASSHPIILARHILLLANLLQDMHADEENIVMSEPPQKIMERLLDTVTTLVLTKESLVATVDGLQCVLLEGCFHANGGAPSKQYRHAGDITQQLRQQ